MDILNSDDSNRDAEDRASKKKTTGKKEDKITLGYEGTTNEFNDQDNVQRRKPRPNTGRPNSTCS